MHNHFTLK